MDKQNSYISDSIVMHSTQCVCVCVCVSVYVCTCMHMCLTMCVCVAEMVEGIYTK